jgi:hypothetical protein
MLRILVTIVAVLALCSPVFAATAAKDGTPALPTSSHVVQPHQILSDWTYNTGGYAGYVPDTGGSATGWAEYFVTTVLNSTGNDLTLVELGFPCCGPTTSAYGWVVWMNMGGMVAPGAPTTAQFHGQFTPVDPAYTFPPTTYTYVDVSAAGMTVPMGEYFCFGYDVTLLGGMTGYNGVTTWGWWSGYWDPDSGWGRTAVLEVSANFGATATEAGTWSAVKALYR